MAVKRIDMSETEWKTKLTPEQYHVAREKGTEPAFTGAFWDNHEQGVYTCVACGAELFRSDDKYDSGTGWPSFTAPVDEEKVIFQEDLSYGMRRVEVKCAACGAHLGHVFEDGPAPSNQRFCINSISLDFEEK